MSAPSPPELGFTRVRHFRVVEVGYIRLRLGWGWGRECSCWHNGQAPHVAPSQVHADTLAECWTARCGSGMLCNVPTRIDFFGVSMSDIKRASYSAAPGKFYPVVLCFFVGSGLAALIYEIVWFQLLEFIIGSTAASLLVSFGAFIVGMFL